MTLSIQQKIQASEYKLPYHYFVSFDPVSLAFCSFRRLGFAVYYAVTAKLVFDTIQRLGVRSWLDVGCGDGALISGLDQFLPDVVKEGVDYDVRSIELAKLINPSMTFHSGNILQKKADLGVFEFVTLIEVLEHIPPDEASEFLVALGTKVAESGFLMITVPHVNQRMPQKHYRHFDFQTLRAELSVLMPEFDIEEMYGVGEKNILERLVKGLLNTKYLFLELPGLNRQRFRAQLKAIPVTETKTQQVAVLLKKRASS